MALMRSTDYSNGFLGFDARYTLSFSGAVRSKELTLLIQKLTVDRDFMKEQEESRDLGRVQTTRGP